MFESVVSLATRIREKQISSKDLVAKLLRRIEEVNPKLNAVIHRLYDQASEVASYWTSQVQAGKNKAMNKLAEMSTRA